ncbi:3-hydroxyacyl-ACP dehydratase FabZ [Ligilactobacillus pobuzihii]|uniref:3-hydroxyacyl-[acyl-carrier-protein] dehydratase FabZ n=1 Tax=Ligilactobacillus pobuzihii TaxID=449659 RepID=A0A0R2LC47_9LACO|nr:3-hydroxyacyl-ACP dehydratase FabZ [Ligilactobacillus pobuzihii]KRK10038.1 (3R)-hydroxymyristoyl-ACP dehydratase [Ligilactobacillus pobuzihii E100301 = KCTC 13174]KRN96263.1 (3R)-hydroxymyristoyl-ACP dehydratase [Ligilactobacillus pobuzihii]GEN48459.1 3-hydroxyacyl-[acyl-carrier-protein] dehydratase FabZ [Ligilactobacillus pobuzihii]HIZ96746.1 3-hydroxyacyl-ACP dehydratase FabZ [Candidatus Ligilactobacillus excrementavium]
MTVLDSTQIQEIIPHRYPMLLIDRIEELEPGQRAVSLRNVTAHEEIFQGHFPGNPVMPGVLIVEAMAQTGAVALLTLDEFKGKTAYFGGIKQAKFRKVVRPGDQMVIEVNLEKIRGNVGLGKAVAKVDGKKACTAEITFMIGD